MSSLSGHNDDQRSVGTDIGHHRAGGLQVVRRLRLLLGLFVLGSCEAGQQSALAPLAVAAADAGSASVKLEESRMWMTIGERRFAITLNDDATARAFAAQLPLTLDMAELNGNEQHGELQKALPTDAGRPGTIRNGDLMLYGTTTLVIFYLTFDSSYAYTRVGRVDDSAGLADALGPRGTRVVFSKD